MAPRFPDSPGTSNGSAPELRTPVVDTLAYERERLATMARNQDMLRALGIAPKTSEPSENDEPEWMSSALEYLEDVEVGDDWDELLEVWAAFECVMGYPDGKVRVIHVYCAVLLIRYARSVSLRKDGPKSSVAGSAAVVNTTKFLYPTPSIAMRIPGVRGGKSSSRLHVAVSPRRSSGRCLKSSPTATWNGMPYDEEDATASSSPSWGLPCGLPLSARTRSLPRSS